MTLGGGSNGWDLYYFMCSMGYSSSDFNRGMAGSRIFTSAQQNFQDFSEGINTAQTSFPKFRSHLLTKGKENLEHFTNRPLSVLHYIGSLYFKARQSSSLVQSTHLPQTIREMLYFLAALQFSPQYDAFDTYVTEYFKTLTGNQSGKKDDLELKLQVADSNVASTVSGTSASSSGDALSAADLKSYLASTFHLAPAFIGLIQEPSTSDEPWLHSLFSNSQFNLSIPSSGAGIFGALSNYTYALQFQLSFLYIQCRDTYTVGCGWNQCTFGQGINKSTASQIVESHICATGCTKDQHKQGDHASGNCEHAKCGEDTNGSPLQAFLTDKLKSFSRGHPSEASDHLATCSGYLCHVPMGFNPNDLRAESNANTQGSHISLALGSFCGGFNTPLRQLSEKLGCLTKRTPRSLGDLFGFLWHLNSQLFPKTSRSDIITSNWFGELKDKLPFSYHLKNESGENLNKFVGTWHTDSTSHNTADLTSLYSSGCNKSTQTCGPYLYPLTHSDGATFGKPAPYASTYLSWMVYLTDDLQSQFQEMLDEFKNIDCKASGCLSKQGCTSHPPGTHGTSNTCTCDSVVHCGGVLPLFYRYGFRFLSAFRLKGVGKDGTTKRSCDKFHSALSNVLAEGAPLTKLLESIDDFLYMFRYYFLTDLSGFWTMYVCVILYTFFFLLDTLHLRSHLKLTSSHTVPPLAVLTSGKPLPITKLTYFTQ
ncbi:uncharacterized protein BcabD6B2_44630 [Babesia caballi]|uniref:Uncharacterized protein n=1 Tax=Babesia caballi TaxID=5871 RepID=A0AAV4LZ73_BABCB|nr:hypothetical protein, conserved [Babesia caballi]